MFLGHFALGFLSKRYAPRVSLGMLILAAQLLDLLWPIFLLLGIEHVALDPSAAAHLAFTSYPYSHSLLFVLGWGFLAGLAWFSWKKDARSSILIGALVVSHWFLDLLVHEPDLPLWPGGPLLGFNLWATQWLIVPLELAFFAFAFTLYLRSTRAADSVGRYGVWGLGVLLLAIHLGNVFGPAPPSVSAIAWAGNLQWLFVGFAYWIDAHRVGIKPSVLR